MLAFRNNTGAALTLFDGPRMLTTIANGQLVQNLPVTVTSFRVAAAAAPAVTRTNGAFVDGNTYAATYANPPAIRFEAVGQPTVTFG